MIAGKFLAQISNHSDIYYKIESESSMFLCVGDESLNTAFKEIETWKNVEKNVCKQFHIT